jgi:hypothetical protein
MYDGETKMITWMRVYVEEIFVEENLMYVEDNCIINGGAWRDTKGGKASTLHLKWTSEMLIPVERKLCIYSIILKVNIKEDVQRDTLKNIIIFSCGTGSCTQGLHLEPFHQPFFVMSVFKIGSRELFAQLQTSILLISASWVARITGMSHQCPAKILKKF